MRAAVIGASAAAGDAAAANYHSRDTGHLSKSEQSDEGRGKRAARDARHAQATLP